MSNQVKWKKPTPKEDLAFDAGCLLAIFLAALCAFGGIMWIVDRIMKDGGLW